MSKKIPQRDVNLARRLIRTGGGLLNTGTNLLDAEQMHASDDDVLKMLEDSMLDCISYIREYRRKINAVELKGQRA